MGQTYLTYLSLTDNDITTIDINTISKLKYLDTLYLSGNYIQRVPNGIFKSSLGLGILDLSRNRIRFLERGAFKGLEKLSELLLSTNQIRTIEMGTFEEQINLVSLDLSGNQLKTMPQQTLSKRELDLSYKLIETLPIFPNSLQYLNLRNNNIVDFSNRSFVGLSSLSMFDVSHNQIRECTLHNIPQSMSKLNLSSNNISVISFNLSPNLRFADLRDNQLISLTVKPIQKPVQKSWYTLGHIFVAGNGNPFRCDCNLEWRKSSFNYEDRYVIKYCIWEFTSLNCSPVYEDEPGVLTEIDLANFDCRYTVSCPDNCACYHWRYRNNINIVECQDAGLTSVPNNISATCTFLDLSGNMFYSLMTGNFWGLSQLVELYLKSSNVKEIQEGTFGELFYLIKLDLSFNSIRRVNSGIFKGLNRLSSLDLACNRVHFVEEGTFKSLNGLKNLDLSDNEIEQISNHDMTSMYTLKSLKLSKNPWSCECSFLDNFVKLTKQECIYDQSDITCRTLNKTELRITRIHMKEFCPDKPDNSDTADTVAITISTAVGVFAITVIIGILWFKNREFLKVCCFIHFGWLFGSTPNDEQDKPYDAFVSYSSWDDGFVARELMPRLEGPLPGQQGYTLCVHFRDFPVGASIAETILDAVKYSRRVIMIISDNFLRSEWCHFEFQAAHLQLMREKKSRIITVLLHDINTNLLDDHLRMFLSTITYVKYGDPFFWNKIEYAMPKRKPATEDNVNADNHEGQVNDLPAVFDENADDDIQLIQ